MSCSIVVKLFQPLLETLTDSTIQSHHITSASSFYSSHCCIKRVAYMILILRSSPYFCLVSVIYDLTNLITPFVTQI